MRPGSGCYGRWLHAVGGKCLGVRCLNVRCLGVVVFFWGGVWEVVFFGGGRV